MTSPQTTLEAVQFNQGLPLLVARRPVRVPQWRRGEPSFPAAIAGFPDHLLITVGLASDRPAWSARLKAARMPGTLAAVHDVPETPVTFDERGRADVSVLVRLENPAVDVGAIIWNWQVLDGTTWLDIGRSDHEIAVTISEPTTPWATAPKTGRTQPWWEVVRHACEGARGATDLDDAAMRLTLFTFHGWNRGLYKWDASRHFATNAFETPSAFNCDLFLRLLDGEKVPDRLDCSDLAAVLSTFANVLGCALQQTAIGRTMKLNPILLTGHTRWESRSSTFGVHEFTVMRSSSKIYVWDGCLTLSSNDAEQRPGNVTPNDVVVPTGMSEAEYLDRLLVSNEMTIAKRFGQPNVRPIGPLPKLASPVDSNSPMVVAGAALWTPPADAISTTGRIEALSFGSLAPAGWEPIDASEPVSADSLDADADTVERAIWRATDGSSRVVSITAYICADTRGAQLRTQAILGELLPLGAPVITSKPAGQAREYRLAFREGETIVGTVINVAYIVRGAREGTAAADVEQVFAALSNHLLTAVQ